MSTFDYSKVISYAQEHMKNGSDAYDASHDINHVKRVFSYAQRIVGYYQTDYTPHIEGSCIELIDRLDRSKASLYAQCVLNLTEDADSKDLDKLNGLIEKISSIEDVSFLIYRIDGEIEGMATLYQRKGYVYMSQFAVKDVKTYTDVLTDALIYLKEEFPTVDLYSIYKKGVYQARAAYEKVGARSVRLDEIVNFKDWNRFQGDEVCVMKFSGSALPPDKMNPSRIHRIYMASILHDVRDHKYDDGNQISLSKMIEDLQSMFDCSPTDAKVICAICDNVSWSKEQRGEMDDMGPYNLELQIVQDADRLDAIGTVGSWRCWMYQQKHGGNLGEFFKHHIVKLLPLTHQMNTVYASKLAQKRYSQTLEYSSLMGVNWLQYLVYGMVNIPEDIVDADVERLRTFQLEYFNKIKTNDASDEHFDMLTTFISDLSWKKIAKLCMLLNGVKL